MASHDDRITVQISGKSYHVACDRDEVPALKQAVDIVNQQLHRLTGRGYSPHTERGMMMLALDLAHELVSVKNQQHAYIEQMSQKIQDLHKKIEKELAES